MSKSKRLRKDDEDEDFGPPREDSCSTLDHKWPPNVQPDTRCYCGKKPWKPLIDVEDRLKPGMLIRTFTGPGSRLYIVEMVNFSRAHCRAIAPERALAKLRGEDQAPVFMPMPGMKVVPDADGEIGVRLAEDEERRGHTIDISPQSCCPRVTEAELEVEIQSREDRQMAGKIAGLPIAGSKAKKLAQMPKSTAKPLSGAAAKAKANKKERPPKTVRACGCGCGGETTAYFVPGHDARYKSWMKQLGEGKIDQAGLRKLMGQKTFGKYSFKKKGAGFVANETYQEAAGA